MVSIQVQQGASLMGTLIRLEPSYFVGGRYITGII